jgi:4-amino-4-deoxy-L-arabinose transferase-like glycosyltransferase
MQISRSSGLAVAAAAALVLLPNLGGPPLWDDDEPRNAACSLAMHRTGDWVVPTFNGRLRVEKPVLVNWLHLAGFAAVGVNETGARLASALLTVGTCLLTMHIGGTVFRPAVGPWCGLAMATCLSTGVGGRAATPDAPLVFCTTLALWLFIRAARAAAGGDVGWRDGPVRLTRWGAVGVGVACGLAMMAKGPIGVALPLLGLGSFCWWQAALDPGRVGSRLARLWAAFASACHGLRPQFILAAAAAVALPWYVAVTIRTEGAWLHGFLFIHNLGRLAAPMEGHSGSVILYYPIVILIGMFPWSTASVLVARHAVATVRNGCGSTNAVGMRLVICWIAAWLVPLSLSGTKLPGYIWPAFPAIAVAVGLFVADWIDKPSAATDRWMRLAWLSLAASGLALAIGLPLVTRRLAPGAEWLGLIGLVPLGGAGIAWAAQSLSSRRAASATWAAVACGTLALLLTVGPACVGHVGGTRQLMAAVREHERATTPIASFRAPASAVFYAGRIAPTGTVPQLAKPSEAATFVADNPGGHLVVNARFEKQVVSKLPPHYGVLRAATSFPSLQEVLLIGPRTSADAPSRLAAERPESLRR